MLDSWSSPRFPSVRFGTWSEFEAYISENQGTLDSMYVLERSRATREPAVVEGGVCAPCLRQTVFTSPTQGGEAIGDGTVMPDWRAAQMCGCDDRLPHLSRAVLHFMQANGLIQPWHRHLLFGPASNIVRRLAADPNSVVLVRRLDAVSTPSDHSVGLPAQYSLNARPKDFHSILSFDYLQHIPSLDSALEQLRTALLPGGSLIFTIPFRALQRHTVSNIAELPGPPQHWPVEVGMEVHAIGWDILDRLRAVGFSVAEAHMYWSAELGYLGPKNMIFRAAV